MINGFVLSILWPSLIRLLSEDLPREAMGKSSVVMASTAAAGTIIIYGLSSLFAYLDNFKLAFYTAAVTETFAAVFWLLLYNKKAVVTETDNGELSGGAETVSSSAVQEPQQTGNKKRFFWHPCICYVSSRSELI